MVKRWATYTPTTASRQRRSDLLALPYAGESVIAAPRRCRLRFHQPQQRRQQQQQVLLSQPLARQPSFKVVGERFARLGGYHLEAQMTGGTRRAFRAWKRLTGHDADGGNSCGNSQPNLGNAVAAEMRTDEEAMDSGAASQSDSRRRIACGSSSVSAHAGADGSTLTDGDLEEDASTHLLADSDPRKNADRKESEVSGDWKDEGDAPLTRQTVAELLLCILAFVGRGFCLNSLGPTLLDLRQLTHAPVEDSAVIFVSQSAGLFVGSLVAKIIFDRINHELAMFAALLLQALATAAVPLTSMLAVMCFAFGCQGFCIGIVGIGVTTLCLELGGKKRNGMYLQAVYLGVSVGSIVGPFMAKPFLSVEAARQGSTKITDLMLHPVRPMPPKPLLAKTAAFTEEQRLMRGNGGANQSVSVAGVATTMASMILSTVAANLTTEAIDREASVPHTTSTIAMPNDSHKMQLVNGTSASQAGAQISYTATQVAYDYYLIAAILALPSVGFLVLFVLKYRSFAGTRRRCWVAVPSRSTSDRCSRDGGREGEDNNRHNDVLSGRHCCFCCRRCPPLPLLGFMVLLFMQCLVFFGMQDSYSNLLTTFVVMSKLRLHKVRGVYATSTFWAAICFGRLNGIWVARFVSPFRMLLFDTVLAAAAAIALLTFGEQNEYVLWIFSAALGLAFATVNAATVSWAAARVAGGTGRASGHLLTVIMVGRCTGLLTIPTAVAAVFRIAGAASLMRALLVVTIIHLICLVGGELIAKRCSADDGKLRGQLGGPRQPLRKQTEDHCASPETVDSEEQHSPHSRR